MPQSSPCLEATNELCCIHQLSYAIAPALAIDSFCTRISFTALPYRTKPICLFSHLRIPLAIMSFDQLSVTEAQPTTMRRQDDPEYRDDPEYSRFTQDLSVKLFSLTSNVTRLSQQVSLLGTKRDTERVRERVHDLLEEAREGFKEGGEGIKRLMAWENLNVSLAWVPGSAMV